VGVAGAYFTPAGFTLRLTKVTGVFIAGMI
jgi:hypothetical protein